MTSCVPALYTPEMIPPGAGFAANLPFLPFPAFHLQLYRFHGLRTAATLFFQYQTRRAPCSGNDTARPSPESAALCKVSDLLLHICLFLFELLLIWHAPIVASTAFLRVRTYCICGAPPALSVFPLLPVLSPLSVFPHLPVLSPLSVFPLSPVLPSFPLSTFFLRSPPFFFLLIYLHFLFHICSLLWFFQCHKDRFVLQRRNNFFPTCLSALCEGWTC